MSETILFDATFCKETTRTYLIFLSCRNQSNVFQCNLVDWLLYDGNNDLNLVKTMQNG